MRRVAWNLTSELSPRTLDILLHDPRKLRLYTSETAINPRSGQSELTFLIPHLLVGRICGPLLVHLALFTALFRNSLVHFRIRSLVCRFPIGFT